MSSMSKRLLLALILLACVSPLEAHGVSAEDPPSPRAATGHDVRIAAQRRPPQGAATSYSVLVPTRSLTRATTVLDLIELTLLVPASYQPVEGPEREALLKGLERARAARVYVRAGAGGGQSVLALALAPRPDGAHELVVYAHGDGSGASAAQRDAESFRYQIEGFAASAGGGSSSGRSGLGAPDTARYHVYQVSHVQSDRLLGVLKALGYSTVEYDAMGGESMQEKIFSPRPGGTTYPIIVKMIDSAKTSLQDPAPAGGGARSGVGDPMYLHSTTSSDPQQLLLIVYDEDDPEPLHRLLTLMTEQLDTPARQVLIEVQVIEVNEDASTQLGIDWGGSKGGISLSSQQSAAGVKEPLIFNLAHPSFESLLEFNVRLEALVTSGEAEVLSRPSVLALDGRQAVISVGQEIPITRDVVVSQGGVSSSISYMNVGITLNIRPRVSADGQEVGMQLEARVSSISATDGALAQAGDSALYAPATNSREVQTFVRVANDNPFIVGGLIASGETKSNRGVPLLSRIPGLGVLFSHKSLDEVRKEVIIVVTPHVIERDVQGAEARIRPMEEDRFDLRGAALRQDSYRLRSADVVNLENLRRSDAMSALVAEIEAAAVARPDLRHAEPWESVLEGRVPGEDILARRLLYDIIEREGYGAEIDPRRIVYFSTEQGALGVEPLKDALSEVGRDGALLVSFAPGDPGAGGDDPALPLARVAATTAPEGSALEGLRSVNTLGPEGSPSAYGFYLERGRGLDEDMRVLRNIFALQRLIQLNSGLPLTIAALRPGREIIVPGEADLASRFYAIDGETVRLYYEISDYHQAFERAFEAGVRELQQGLAP